MAAVSSSVTQYLPSYAGADERANLITAPAGTSTTRWSIWAGGGATIASTPNVADGPDGGPSTCIEYTVTPTLTSVQVTAQGGDSASGTVAPASLISSGYRPISGGLYSATAAVKLVGFASSSVYILAYLRDGNGKWITSWSGTPVAVAADTWTTITANLSGLPDRAEFAAFYVFVGGLTSGVQYKVRVTALADSPDPAVPLYSAEPVPRSRRTTTARRVNTDRPATAIASPATDPSILWGANAITDPSFEVGVGAWRGHPVGAPLSINATGVALTQVTTDAAPGAGTKSAEFSYSYTSASAAGPIFYGPAAVGRPVFGHGTHLKLRAMVKLVASAGGAPALTAKIETALQNTYSDVGTFPSGPTVTLTPGVWTEVVWAVSVDSLMELNPRADRCDFRVRLNPASTAPSGASYTVRIDDTSSAVGSPPRDTVAKTFASLTRAAEETLVTGDTATRTVAVARAGLEAVGGDLGGSIVRLWPPAKITPQTAAVLAELLPPATVSASPPATIG